MSNVSLYSGDCLEVMPTLPDGCADMILADLPYGTTACKWDTVIPFDLLWPQYKRLIKRNGAIVLFGSQPFTSALVMSNPAWFRYCWVWDKQGTSNFFSAKSQPLKSHEDICIFYEVSPTYNPQMGVGKPNGKPTNSIGAKYEHRVLGTTRTVLPYEPTNSKYPRSILHFPKSTKTHTLHPTQKPVALGEYLIRTYTNEGETVLDNTMGSGSFGVSAVNTNRDFIGIEKDAGYFAIAKQRTEEAQSKVRQAEFVA